MNRRTFIASTGCIGAVAIGGTVVLSNSSEPSKAATVEFQRYTFTGTINRDGGDDGPVADVRAGATDIAFQYEGLDEKPDEATIELQVVHDGDTETIDETATGVTGTSQSNVSPEAGLEGSVLDHDGLSVPDFKTDEDDGATEKDVTLRLEVTVSDSSGSSETDLNAAMRNGEGGASVSDEADSGDEDDSDARSVEEINAIIGDINAELENVDSVDTIDDTDDETIDKLVAEIFTQVTAEIEAQGGGEYDVSTPEEAREAADDAWISAVSEALNDAADAVEEIQRLADE